MVSKFLYNDPKSVFHPMPALDDVPSDASNYKDLWKMVVARYRAGVKVQANWLHYSEFLAFAKDHYYGRNYFFSSFLVTPTDNAVSETTALFIPRDIWRFVKPNRSVENCVWRGTTVIENNDGEKYRAQGTFRNETRCLGLFTTQTDAHFAWLAWKIECGYKLLAELDPRCRQVREAFIAHLNRMEKHLKERKEFKL